jgi:hypothetical protein
MANSKSKQAQFSGENYAESASAPPTIATSKISMTTLNAQCSTLNWTESELGRWALNPS